MKKNGNYLIAVSGGPDSMALLDMMYKKGMNIFCAHVNYHKRDTAIRDEKIVKKYCQSHNIKLYKLDVKEYKGNFQDYARVVRYKFFAEIVKKHKLDGLLVAHHLDDFLETYLMQIERGSIPNYYGLNCEVTLQDIKVYRPLLKYTKSDLEKYCLTNNIEYGIDESNLTNHYKRNRIRHEVIDKMSLKEKKALKKEIDELNKKNKEKKQEIKSFLKEKTRIDYKDYLKFKDKEALLRYLMHDDLSTKFLNELIKQIDSTERLEIRINNQYLVKENNYIEVFDEIEDYEYKITKLEYKKYNYFKLAKKGSSLEGVTVKKSDFPLTIRNFKKGDFIKMRYGTKKINRFFIDNKIPSIERKKWPIILNKYNEVILVPGIGCSVNSYSIKHNLFVIKL